MERDFDAGCEVADHFCAVERDDAGFAVGEVVGEEAAAGSEGVACPGDVDVDLLDADFEDVTRFGFFNGDGTGEDVASGTFFGGGIVLIDVADIGGNVGFGYAEGLEALGCSTGGEGLNFDGVAGVDGEDGFGLRGVEAPGYGGGGGEEGLLGVEMQG